MRSAIGADSECARREHVRDREQLPPLLATVPHLCSSSASAVRCSALTRARLLAGARGAHCHARADPTRSHHALFTLQSTRCVLSGADRSGGGNRRGRRRRRVGARSAGAGSRGEDARPLRSSPAPSSPPPPLLFPLLLLKLASASVSERAG
eukprot:1313654-Rhodomonas_salina.2